MIFNDVINDLSYTNRILYVSGFSNPKLRSRAQVNTKPFKVFLRTFSYFTSHDYGSDDFLVAVYLDRDNQPTDNRFDLTYVHELFETEYEAIEYYNKCVDEVLTQVDEMYTKIESNKL